MKVVDFDEQIARGVDKVVSFQPTQFVSFGKRSEYSCGFDADSHEWDERTRCLRCVCEDSLAKVADAGFSSPIVDVLKNELVDLTQLGKIERAKTAVFIEQRLPGSGDLVFTPSKLSGVCDAQFIPQRSV